MSSEEDTEQGTGSWDQVLVGQWGSTSQEGSLWEGTCGLQERLPAQGPPPLRPRISLGIKMRACVSDPM